jgi:acetyl-CoA acyltransferase
MGIGPVKAVVPKVLKQAGLSINDIGLIELNKLLPRSHWRLSEN